MTRATDALEALEAPPGDETVPVSPAGLEYPGSPPPVGPELGEADSFGTGSEVGAAGSSRSGRTATSGPKTAESKPVRERRSSPGALISTPEDGGSPSASACGSASTASASGSPTV